MRIDFVICRFVRNEYGRFWMGNHLEQSQHTEMLLPLLAEHLELLRKEIMIWQK